MLMSIIAIALAILFIGLTLYGACRAIINLRTTLSLQQKHLNDMEEEIARAAERTVNSIPVNIPVTYDAENKTVCVEGNLVATGFIACASKGGDCDA